MNEREKIRKIETFGDLYFGEHLKDWNNDTLDKNWWKALKFFFRHSFFRGRKNKLSNEYFYFAIKVLEDYFSISNNNLDESYKNLKNSCRFYGKEWILNFKKEKFLGNSNSIKHEDFGREVADKNPLVKLLTTPKKVESKYNKVRSLNNDEDVMMVLDVLKIVSNDEKKNIYHYIKETIKNFGIDTAYEDLVVIRAVADKIACFVIRDIGLMNAGLISEHYEKAFPVDTWVNRMAHRLAFKEEKEFLIQKSLEYDVNPLKFAAGLWMWGFNNLNLES